MSDTADMTHKEWTMRGAVVSAAIMEVSGTETGDHASNARRRA